MLIKSTLFGSTNRSVLEGALEVFGKNAAVVIANPNGFYCDKCSFINTSKLTMVSGRSETPTELGFAMLIKSTLFAVVSIYVVGLLVVSTT
jgi:hypothetical protein